MRKIIFFLVGLAALIAIVNPTVHTQMSGDPCSNPQLIQSVAINITSGASTRIVLSTDAEKKTYICNINVTMVGAATPQTLAVQYGTAATCGTGTVLRSGTFKASTTVGSITNLQILQNTIQPIPVGNSTCILTTTADAVNGIASFALQ